MNKIPCSIGILTLNSEKTLRRCLDSVKDFAEIIICDGNSKDKTLEIAGEYGAKIVKQYESDEPNLRCDTDKANVRNKNMNAASYDWYIWLDSDDALSSEVIEEAKKIAANPNPGYLFYNMPMRIFIEGGEIKHSSNYPMYQIRLFSRKTGARFIKPVHERIEFDKEKFRVGKLNGYYDIHWSRKRAENFWQGTILPYVDYEISQYKGSGFFNYLKWILFYRFKQILRILILSLKNYLVYGFKNSMPAKIELARIGYHFLIFWRLTKKQFLGL